MGALDELADLVLGTRPGHALADDDQGAFGGLEGAERCFHRVGIGLRPRRFGHRRCLDHFLVFHFAADDVVREIQVNRARATVDGMAHGLVDIVGNAVDVLDGVGVLAIRRGELDLALFLETAHAVLVDRRCAPDQDHRPAVLLGVGESGEGVDDARSGYGEAGLRTAREVAGRVGGIAGRLFIAHADVGYAGLLCFSGHTLDREAHDPEHVVDALLLETARHELGAVDRCHGSSPWRNELWLRNRLTYRAGTPRLKCYIPLPVVAGDGKQG